jgi:hypothetical protein
MINSATASQQQPGSVWVHGGLFDAFAKGLESELLASRGKAPSFEQVLTSCPMVQQEWKPGHLRFVKVPANWRAQMSKAATEI